MRKDNRTIAEMKNLGPTAQDDFNAVGITTAEQLKALGVEKAFLKMLDGRAKNGKSINCINASYLYAIYGAIQDIDWRMIPENKKAEFKKFTSTLRKTGFY